MTLAAGFDLGGTQLKFGLVDEAGRILVKDKVDTPKGIEDLVALFGRVYRELKAKSPAPVAAVGFGIPGTYDLRRRRILQSPNYPSLDGYDLDPALRREIDVPFRVDNDANMAAYGEWVAGAGRGVGSLVLLTIGTGIGGGIILDGRLWQGQCGYGGEVGHIVVHPDGERCACGLQGCLETEASAPAIVASTGPSPPARRRESRPRMSIAGPRAARRTPAGLSPKPDSISASVWASSSTSSTRPRFSSAGGS